MSAPFFRVRLRLLAAGEGGRSKPIFSGYRPDWDLGNSWLGQPTINGGQVFLEDRDELAPGAEGLARIEPIASELWGRVRVGSVIAMREGKPVVGYAAVLEIVAPPDYWSPEVAAFVDQARQFCDLVEKAREYSLAERLAAFRHRLLELYASGSTLPVVNPPEGIEAGPSRDRPKDWAGFGDVDTYWEVFDPYVGDAPVAGSLSDDVLDIYRDLQRGLTLWDHDAAANSDAFKLCAIWEWRFHFETHWGDHAIDALRALHRACKRG
ncbi:MAG TPA: DUF5063 domain-containing protein [Kofleriaceae bacterium]|jgi:hypothetical protein